MRRCFLFLLIVLLAACGREQAPAVLATIQPYGILARELAGDSLAVGVFLPPAASPHTYNPTPRDADRLRAARLVIANGLGLETFLESSLRALGTNVVVAAGYVPSAIRPGHDDGEGDGHDGHEHALGNPHLWLDPVAMQSVARGLAARLALSWPAHKAAIEGNLARVLADLEALDRELRADSARYRQKNVIVFHDAYAWLTARYGVKVVAVLRDSPGREASPQRLAELTRLARERGVRALFREPQFDGKAALVLSRELGLPVHLVDPLGGQSPPSTLADLIRNCWRELARGFVR